MPVFQLNKEIVFPPVRLTEESGILAIGGDLSPERLILAYQSGIFPWFNKGDPIIWWSPDPRFVLYPSEIIISKSMKKVINQKRFLITFDRNFRDVITACSKPRKKQRGTWITDEMLEAYCRLHSMGFAHSVEAWYEDHLAGGLYGVSLGRCFFGESMFSEISNASKASLISLNSILLELKFLVIDSQVYTDHLASMGAREIPREEYMVLLKKGLRYPTIRGNWGKIFS